MAREDVEASVMTRFRRCACGRWKATERQSARWFKWCQLASPRWCYAGYNVREPFLTYVGRRLRSKLTEPLWWRLSTRCLEWHDCAATYSEGAPIDDYPWHVRALFRIPKRVRA
jgi:hypothetical protein